MSSGAIGFGTVLRYRHGRKTYVMVVRRAEDWVNPAGETIDYWDVLWLNDESGPGMDADAPINGVLNGKHWERVGE